MEWKDITIEQYQEVVSIAGTDLPEFNKEMEVVRYLFNIDKDELLNMPIERFKHYSKQIEFLGDVYEGEMQTEFELNGKTYSVHWEMQKRSAGQFIDLTELTKDKDMIVDNMHKLMAVICVPKGEKYDGNIKERSEEFRKHLTMDVTFPISGFFLTVLKASLPVIQDYLTRNIEAKKKELLQMIKDSMSIGDGIPHLTN